MKLEGYHIIPFFITSQSMQGWGATVTSRLANDIKNELREIKGFSERNLQFMVQFYKEYDFESVIAKQPVSQLQDSIIFKVEFMKQPVSQIPWGHNILLIQKVKEKKTRALVCGSNYS
ncbi:hypothetical protein ACVWYN_001158 [Pedobacter sp. UYP24]